MSKNTIDNWDKAVGDILQEYGRNALYAVQKVCPDIGKEAANQLKASSPRLTGSYAKGWTVTTETKRTGTKTIVHNKTDYQLTHLLENGHANRGGGRTRAYPHIGAVNDWAAEELEKRVEEEMQ